MYARLLYELQIPALAVSAAIALREYPSRETQEALFSLIQSPPLAAAGLAAIDTCLAHGYPNDTEMLISAAQSAYSSMRRHALLHLLDPVGFSTLSAALQSDPAWSVRQAAMQSMAAIIEASAPTKAHSLREECLVAIDDPHWRVRNDLLQHMLSWCQGEPDWWARLCKRYHNHPDPRVQGMICYLSAQQALFLASSEGLSLSSAAQLLTPERPPAAPRLAAEQAPWWSDDPPVLRRHLAALSMAQAKAALPLLMPLLTHEDAGVRRIVSAALRQGGDLSSWVALLRRLEQPRTPYLVQVATPLLQSLHEDRREALVLEILASGAQALSVPLSWRPSLTSPAALCWALSQSIEGWCDDPPANAIWYGSRILALCTHKDLQVCLAALDAIARIAKAESFSLDAKASVMALLRQLLSHQEERISIVAWCQLCGLSSGRPQGLADAMAQLPPPPHSSAWQEAIAQALLDAGALSGFDAFWHACSRSESPAIRKLAALVASQATAHRELLAGGDPATQAGIESDCIESDSAGLSNSMSSDGGWQQMIESLQADPVPAVREAAMTRARAEQIWASPSIEKAWEVRCQAARLLKRGLAPLLPPASETAALEATALEVSAHEVDILEVTALEVLQGPLVTSPEWPRGAGFVHGLHPLARPLGKTGLRVVPLGISGHYALPEEGFGRALDAGVNLFFWEPNYNTQTRFFRDLLPAEKRDLVTVAGTFEAEPKAILRDLERALAMQGLEQIKLWLIFWVRDWQRLSVEMLELLRECQRQGKIHRFGMSTHHRPLAIRAVEAGWDVVMVRHNAAHRGAEESFFTKAQAAGTGVLTFNNLNYGRMLRPLAATLPAPPSAADCYRFSLAQPAVSATFSAPYDLAQLEDNLQVLDDLRLPPEREAQMCAFGELMVRKNRLFADCIRNR